MEADKLAPKPILFLILGILIAAPVFYIIGYQVADTQSRGAVETAKLKYELASKALEKELARNEELEGEIIRQRTVIDRLAKALSMVKGTVSGLRVSGSADGVTVEYSPAYFVGARFCIEMDIRNEEERQITIDVALSGEGVQAERKEVSLYPGEKRPVRICGTMSETAAEAEIMINGNVAGSTALVLE